MSSVDPQFQIVQDAAEQLDLRPRSLWGDAWNRVLKSPLALTCLAIVLVYFLIGLASLFPAFQYTNSAGELKGLIWEKVGRSFQPPTFVTTVHEGRRVVHHVASPALWFGTDLFGHSVLWATLYGARVALEITIGASVLAIGIGVVLGVVAGYFGSWVDTLIIWLFTTVSAVPWILMVIALTFALEGYGNAELRPPPASHAAAVQAPQPADAATHPAAATPRPAAPPPPSISDRIFNAYTAVNGWLSGMLPVILAMGLTDWVGLCRLIRGEVLSLRQRDFVAAAQASGLGNGRILFRHIVPQVTHIVIITFSLGCVGYVQAEVVLSFIGLGVANQPSWGGQIDAAKLELLQGVWWPAAAATLAIFVLCFALNILGDFLRDALDPRLRGA